MCLNLLLPSQRDRPHFYFHFLFNNAPTGSQWNWNCIHVTLFSGVISHILLNAVLDGTKLTINLCTEMKMQLEFNAFPEAGLFTLQSCCWMFLDQGGYLMWWLCGQCLWCAESQQTSAGISELVLWEALINLISAPWDRVEGVTDWKWKTHAECPLQPLLFHRWCSCSMAASCPVHELLTVVVLSMAHLCFHATHLGSQFNWHQEDCKGASWAHLHRARAHTLRNIEWSRTRLCWNYIRVEVSLSAIWLDDWHIISPTEKANIFSVKMPVIQSILTPFLSVEAIASMILISAGFCAPTSIRNPRTYTAVLWRPLELFFFKVTANIIMPAAHSALH